MYYKKTIKECSEGLMKKDFSAEEFTRVCLDRITAEDGDVNAFIHVQGEAALDQARKVDADRAAGNDLGPLAGVPIAIKNNILVKGWKTSGGSQILENYTATYNATVIDRLLEAGAVLIGSANMDEFAMGSSTESSHFGATKNPWDKERIPGGSSGGSVAAVAARFVPGALGSDTGGSIRQPASLCGVTGLKPTYGRVSRYGIMALASSLDQIGPITQTVEDAAMLLQVIEGQDDKDATSVQTPETTIPELLPKDMKGVRVGIPKEYFVDGMDIEIKKAVMEAVAVLEAGGAEIKEVSLPHAEYALATYYVVMPCEASSNLARYDGIRYGLSASGKDLIDSYKRTRSEGFGDEVKRRIMIGTYALSHGYYDAYYKKAQQVRTLIRREFTDAFLKFDALVTPTSPGTAFKIGAKMDDPFQMYMNDICTIPVNIAGLPSISIPGGMSEGLPVGLQFIGPQFGDTTVIRAAAAYERATAWHKNHPLI